MDFSAYYVAGSLASEKPPERLYYHSVYPDGRIDPAAYADGWPKVTSRYGVSKAITFVYPPLFAVLMKPFAYFSYDVAYVLWTIVTVVLTFASVLFSLSLGEKRVSIELALILIVGLFSYFPFYEELVLGQVGSLILFVCACGIWLLSRNRIWSSAFCLALATMIKITPIIVVPLLVFHRKWKWLAAYGCWMVCMLAFSIWQAGWAAHAQFLHSVMPSVSCGIPSSYNASIVVYVQELFLGYVPTAKLPLALPALACTVSKAVSFVIFVAMIVRFYLYRRQQNLIRDLILMILVSLVISPISWWHHYTIALLPFIYLWCTMRRGSGTDPLLLTSVLVVGTNVAGFGVQLSSNHVAQLSSRGDCAASNARVGVFQSLAGRAGRLRKWARVERVHKVRRGYAILVGQSYSVGPHFGGGRVEPISSADAMLDAFVAAEGTIGGPHGPAEGDEGLAGGLGYSGFEPENRLWGRVRRGLRPWFGTSLRGASVGCRLRPGCRGRSRRG